VIRLAVNIDTETSTVACFLLHTNSTYNISRKLATTVLHLLRMSGTFRMRMRPAEQLTGMMRTATQIV
jgi:hypothetical protein